MPTVRLRFPPGAGHIRTARLVAVSASRRLGFDEARLDEVRLAVGEACNRALRRCIEAGVRRPVELSITATGHGLTVEVTDHADRAQVVGGSPADDPVADRPVTDGDGEDPVALALLRGLADAVEVLPGPGGPRGLLRLEWWP